jgi:hypothetical protein
MSWSRCRARLGPASEVHPVSFGREIRPVRKVYQAHLRPGGSYACTQEPFNNVRRTKWIILRNTMQQLKSTVKPLIDQWFVENVGQALGSWRLTENTFEIKGRMPDGTVVHTEFVLMAADTPDDVRRLLSVEASGAWVEEAREVDQAVFEGLQGRVGRFPRRDAGGVTHKHVLCSTNPPPMGTFWHQLMVNPPDNVEVIMQPAAILEDGSLNPEAENLEHLDPTYYENLMQGKSQGWIDVYLRNLFGPGEWGNPVFRNTFKHSFHVSDEPLSTIAQSLNPLLVGMDNGLQAAAVIGQQDMRGRVNIFSDCYVPDGETMGVETFLDRLLVPLLRSKFAHIRPENILFVMDPACWQRSQLNEKTIAMAVTERGFKCIKASTNDPEKRIQAVEALLTRQIDGGPGMLFDANDCQHIVSALEWGYRFKKTSVGQATGTPEKNHFSHCADALQYLALHYNAALSGWVMRPQAKPVQRVNYSYV